MDFNSILIFSEEPEKLADFYKKVFEKEPEWGGGGYYGFKIGGGFITIGLHDKVKGKSKNPERIMINFETDNVRSEFKRVEKLGAKVIAKPYSMTEREDEDEGMLIATFADPDGNYFQLVSPWQESEEDSKNDLN